MKINHLLILVLLLSACGKPTLDYNSQEYLEAIDQFEIENYDSTRMIFLLASKEYQLPDTALNYLALTYHLSNKRDSAIYYWELAVTQNPNFELGYYNLGLMHDYQGNQDAALENYDKAINIDPNSKKALYNKASILYGKNDLSTALELCKQAISVDSSYVLPYYLMGRIYLTRGIPDSAHLVNSKLVELEPNNPEYLFYLAGSESDLGNIEKAIDLYSKSIELSPTNNPSYFNRASLYQGTQRYNLAKKDYRTTLVYEPNQLESRVRLSWIYQEEKELDSMRTELEKVIMIDSTYSDSYLYLGDYYQLVNNNSKACELYHKASELNNQRATERLAKRCNLEKHKSS